MQNVPAQIPVTWSQMLDEDNLWFLHINELAIGYIAKAKGKFIVQVNCFSGINKQETYRGKYDTIEQAKAKLEEWVLEQFNGE